MLILFLELPGFLIHYLTIRRLFHIKKSCFAHAALLFISALIVCMIIFIGDWYNLPPTFFFYLAGIQFCCTDSPSKKLSLALMLSRTPVNNAGAFVNISFLIKLDKYILNCL